MVKKNKKVIPILTGVILLSAILLSGTSCVSAVDEDTNLLVNVQESMTVSVTTPNTWASGGINTFLRNKVILNVTASNPAGFTASMTMKTDETMLVNTSKNTVTLPTLSSASGYQRANFPANYWGYSLGTTATLNSHTYNETDAGNENSYYYPLVARSTASPIIVLTSSTAATSSQDIYFGAKANATKASGTYIGTVVINVVTGVIDNNTNPTTPTDPATPGPTEEVASYTPSGSSHGTTTYSYRSGNSLITEISEGDNTDAYTGYTPPQGVFSDTTSSVSTGSSIADSLAMAATVAATSGYFFFIAAKRKEADDEEDDQQSEI